MGSWRDLVSTEKPNCYHPCLSLLYRYTVMGVAALYTGLIIWRLYVRLDSLRYPIRTYGDLADRLFGPWAKNLVTSLQTLQLIVNVSTNQHAWHHDACRVILIHPDALGGNNLPQQRTGSLADNEGQCTSSDFWQIYLLSNKSSCGCVT